jgi:glutamate transport system permease protein
MTRATDQGTVLYDALGPIGRRRAVIATMVATVVLVGLVALVLYRISTYHQLDRALWSYVFSAEVLRYLLEGLLNNLKAAAISAVLALVLGLFLAFGRLSRNPLIRVPAVAWIEFFRGFPVILLIIFPYLLFPKYLQPINVLWYVVIGLTLYNSAVIAEIYRAGIRSLEKGQSEAASAVGLTDRQAMRLVILPQAIRRMVPLLLTQVIILFKDSTLGYAVTFEEGLKRGAERLGSFEPRVVFQAIIVTAIMFFLVSFVLSRMVAVVERRMRRTLRFTAAAPPVEIEPALQQSGAI